MKSNRRWAALARAAFLMSPCLAILHTPAGAQEYVAPEIPKVPNLGATASLGAPLFIAPLAVTNAASLPVLAAPAASPALLVPSISALSPVAAPSAQMPAAVGEAAPVVGAAAVPVAAEPRISAQIAAPQSAPGQAGKTSLAALQERTAALAKPGAEADREISQLFQGKNNAAAATFEPAAPLTASTDKRENAGMATLKDAIALATKAHHGQKDKGGADYITHPLRLMSKMTTDEEKMTAVLHDVVEDTSITLDDLRAAGYPQAVIDALDLLTRRKTETYEEFIVRIKPNALARKVKLADLEDNMNLSRLPNPQPKDYERVEKYRKSWEYLTDQKMDASAKPNFKYYATLVDGKPRGLFVFNNGGNRLDMIAWNHTSKKWEHDSARVSRYFLSDLEAEEISRAQAEEIARGFQAGVPSEAEFMKISDLAEKKAK
jgi:hypothetical protein